LWSDDDPLFGISENTENPALRMSRMKCSQESLALPQTNSCLSPPREAGRVVRGGLFLYPLAITSAPKNSAPPAAKVELSQRPAHARRSSADSAWPTIR